MTAALSAGDQPAPILINAADESRTRQRGTAFRDPSGGAIRTEFSAACEQTGNSNFEIDVLALVRIGERKARRRFSVGIFYRSFVI